MLGLTRPSPQGFLTPPPCPLTSFSLFLALVSQNQGHVIVPPLPHPKSPICTTSSPCFLLVVTLGSELLPWYEVPTAELGKPCWMQCIQNPLQTSLLCSINRASAVPLWDSQFELAVGCVWDPGAEGRLEQKTLSPLQRESTVDSYKSSPRD